MSEPKKLIDLSKMRRHYAEFRKAWDEKTGGPTLMTIAAVLAAEDLGELLDYLDATEPTP